MQTHALLTGSPAIDAGDNSVCPATDTRGVSRSDGQCDAGAYEASSQGAARMQPLARGAGKVALSLPKGAPHRPALIEGTALIITRTYYVFGTMRVAVRVQGEPEPAKNGVFYLYGDHLGSASLTTNSSGQVIAELCYYTYGETRWANPSESATPTDRRFTGQR